MKQYILFIFILFFLLHTFACKQNPYPASFTTADSLTKTAPDSAIVLLHNIKDDLLTAPEATQMYYHLLCIKANDKAYIPHTSDSLIRSLVNYYEKISHNTHLPEAYYYAGRVYRDLGDAPQALAYFNKATEVIKGEERHPLRSYIYSQMGTLFLYQNMYDEALKIFKDAYQYDVLLKDSIGMVFDLKDIASIHQYKNQLDTSFCYYQDALNLANRIQHQRLMDIIRNQMARIHIQLKEYDLAKEALQPSLNNLHIPSKSSVFSIASKLHYLTGNLDSAAYYYNELLDCGTIYAKQFAHQGLAEIALTRERPQDALIHLKQWMMCNDSINEITATESVHKISALYNYQLREKENSDLKIKNKQNTLFIISTLSLILILIAFFLAYLQYSRRKRMLLKFKLEKLNKIKEELHKKSTAFIDENNEKIKALENELQNISETNNSLKAQLQKQKEIILFTNKQVEIELDEREQAQTSLFNSDIYHLFKKQISSNNHKITEKEWSLLEKTINDTYLNFSEYLYKVHTLSKHELRICLLIKIRILPADMAKLTNHTKESISSTRRRLYEKVFQEKGKPRQWDEFILSL